MPAPQIEPILSALRAVDVNKLTTSNYMIHIALVLQAIINFEKSVAAEYVKKHPPKMEEETVFTGGDGLIDGYSLSFKQQYSDDHDSLSREMRKAEMLVYKLYEVASDLMLGVRGSQLTSLIVGFAAARQDLEAKQAVSLDEQELEKFGDAPSPLNSVECKISVEQLVCGIDLTITKLIDLNKGELFDNTIEALRTLRDKAHEKPHPSQKEISEHMSSYEAIMGHARKEAPQYEGFITRLMNAVIDMVNKVLKAFSFRSRLFEPAEKKPPAEDKNAVKLSPVAVNAS